MTTPTAPAVELSPIVKQAATLHPELLSIPNENVQKMVAMTLISAMATNTEMTFEQAYSDTMSLFSAAQDTAKLLQEEKQRQQKEALDTFSKLVTPIIEEQATAIKEEHRPSAGFRILVRYNEDKTDNDGNTVRDNEGNVVKLPILVSIEPLSVRRIGGASSGTSTGSGRTAGIFKLEGTDATIKLGELADSLATTNEDKESLKKSSARAFLEKKGYKIDESADANNVKWVHKPAA